MYNNDIDTGTTWPSVLRSRIFSPFHSREFSSFHISLVCADYTTMQKAVNVAERPPVVPQGIPKLCPTETQSTEILGPIPNRV